MHYSRQCYQWHCLSDSEKNIRQTTTRWISQQPVSQTSNCLWKKNAPTEYGSDQLDYMLHVNYMCICVYLKVAYNQMCLWAEFKFKLQADHIEYHCYFYYKHLEIIDIFHCTAPTQGVDSSLRQQHRQRWCVWASNCQGDYDDKTVLW